MKDRLILTTEGIKRMDEITPGYYVYSYDDGSPLLIKEIEHLTINEIVQIYSHDCRSQVMTWPEYCVLAGHNQIPFKEIKFDENRVRITKQPDPYTAGFIFCSTDLEEEEISVRSHSVNFMTTSLLKYHIATGRTENGQTYLKWEKNRQDLTWHNFFTGHTFDPASRYYCIPYAYQYGSHTDRMQFIQGVFDAGQAYPSVFKAGTTLGQPHEVTIIHNSKEFISAVQRMLWSLNIPCIVQFHPSYNYMLAADTSREISANFYYNENFIRECIQYNEIALRPDNVLYDEVRVYQLPEPQDVIIPKLYKAGVLYVDVDYMPIASC